MISVAAARAGRVATRVRPMPIHPPDDALLTCDETAEALTRMGFRIKRATLATMATRGGGPDYSVFGRTPLYRWQTSLGCL